MILRIQLYEGKIIFLNVLDRERDRILENDFLEWNKIDPFWIPSKRIELPITEENVNKLVGHSFDSEEVTTIIKELYPELWL